MNLSLKSLFFFFLLLFLDDALSKNAFHSIKRRYHKRVPAHAHGSHQWRAAGCPRLSSARLPPSVLLPRGAGLFLINTHPHRHATRHIIVTHTHTDWKAHISTCDAQHSFIVSDRHRLNTYMPAYREAGGWGYQAAYTAYTNSRQLCLQRAVFTENKPQWWTQRLWQKASILMHYLNYTQSKKPPFALKERPAGGFKSVDIIRDCDFRDINKLLI